MHSAQVRGPRDLFLFTHLLVEVSDSVYCVSYVALTYIPEGGLLTGFAMSEERSFFSSRSRISGGGTTFHSIHDAARQRDNDGRDKNRA